ncbi:NUDIX domain-containing protein [Paenibacillus sp. D51F]
MPAAIRNSVIAILIQDGRILLTRNQDAQGVFHLFPGGGQEHGEELKDAVVRECLEEIGQKVIPGDLLHIREYIGRNHEFSEWDSEIHQVEFYFQCSFPPGFDGSFAAASNPDELQIGVEWVDLDRLHELRIYPRSLVESLQTGFPGLCYRGDTNEEFAVNSDLLNVIMM